MKQTCFDKGWTLDTKVPGDIVGDAKGYCSGQAFRLDHCFSTLTTLRCVDFNSQNSLASSLHGDQGILGAEIHIP